MMFDIYFSYNFKGLYMEIDNMIIYIILENAMEICQKYKEMTFKLSYMGKKSMSQATFPNVWTAKKALITLKIKHVGSTIK